MPQFLPVVGVRPGPAGQRWQPTKAKRLVNNFLGAYPPLRSKDMEAVLIVADANALTDPDVEILVITDEARMWPPLKPSKFGTASPLTFGSQTMIWRDHKWQGINVTHYGGFTLYTLRR